MLERCLKRLQNNIASVDRETLKSLKKDKGGAV
jgi:hypothetical protein